MRYRFYRNKFNHFKNKILILTFFTVVGIGTSCRQQEKPMNEYGTVYVVPEPEEESVDTIAGDHSYKPDTYNSPHAYKDNIESKSNNFEDSSAKHNIPFKEFYADTSLLADMGRLFIIEGTVDELVFSNNAFVIKDLDGDLNYLIFPDDYPETISKLKKYLKVGSRVKSIYALAGARYLQIVELNIY